MNRRPLSFAFAVGALVLCLAVPQGVAMAAASTPPAAQGTPPPAPAAPMPAPVPMPASPPAPATSVPTGPVLTLDQAIQHAVLQNPQVAAAQQSVAAAQEAITIARTGLEPSLTLSGSGGYGNRSVNVVNTSGFIVPLTTVTPTGALTIVADYPLYNSGLTQAEVASAEAALVNAQATLRQTEQDLSLQVATAFFSVLQAERLTTVRQAQLAQAQQALAQAEAQFRAGTAARSDVIQAQSTLAQAQVNLLVAQSQIDTSKAGFKGVLAIDMLAPVDVKEPEAPALAVPIQPDAAVQAAVANRPEVAEAAATVQSDQAALDTAIITAGLQLTLGVGAAYTPYSTGSFSTNTATYGLTGTLSLPLYDSGKGKASINQAKANLGNAQDKLAQEQLVVRQDAYQAYLAAVQGAANITATQAAATAAEEALRVAQGQYSAGVGTILAVTTAQANAAQAEVNAVTAVYTYETALATLQHATGQMITASTR
jgi:outer membrane protein